MEFFTGFEACGSNNDVASLFDYVYAIPVLSSAGGFYETQGMQLSNSYGHVMKKCDPGKTKVVGGHVSNLSTQSLYYNFKVRGYFIVGFKIGDDEIQIVNWSTTNEIRVYKNGTGTLLATGGTRLSTALHHVEVKIFSDDTNGSIHMKINGSDDYILEATDINTGGGDITEIYWGNNGGSTCVWDNIFIADDWKGQVRSFLLSPESDDTLDFTPSEGADGYAMINEKDGHDGDSSYVWGDIIGQQGLHGYEEVPDSIIIKGMSITTVARKTDVSDRKLKTIVKYNDTLYELGENDLLSYYPQNEEQGISYSIDEAPDATELTKEKIDSMKIGYQVA